MTYRVLLVAVSLLPVAAAGATKWPTDFAAAKQASARARQPMLVDFAASWCEPCRMMDEETFPNKGVQELLQRVTLVRLDVDRRPPQAEQYEVNGIPRVLLLPPGGEGRTLMDVEGFCDAETFSAKLRAALGMPTSAAAAAAEPAEVGRLRESLRTGRYAMLKTASPKDASTGLSRLAEQLGATKEADFAVVAALVRKAGPDAVPALLHGMGHAMLAVRAGCYRALQELPAIHGPPRPATVRPVGSREEPQGAARTMGSMVAESQGDRTLTRSCAGHRRSRTDGVSKGDQTWLAQLTAAFSAQRGCLSSCCLRGAVGRPAQRCRQTGLRRRQRNLPWWDTW